MISVLSKRRIALIAGAKRYAAAERSDPFALAVALSEIHTGKHDAVRASDCSMFGNPRYVFHQPKKGQDCGYDAREIRERRALEDGTKFEVRAFRNVVRP